MSRGEAREGRPQGRARENRGRRDPEGSGVPMGSLGLWLRTQREARGVSIRDIADATKISQRYLEALETDRFDALPAEVFVRGFLREYGRIVGLDPDEVVNVYLLAVEEARPEASEDEAAMAPANRRQRSSIIAYGVLVTVLLAVVLGAAAAVSYWLGRERTDSPPPSPAATNVRDRQATAPSGPARDDPPGAATEAEPQATEPRVAEPSAAETPPPAEPSLPPDRPAPTPAGPAPQRPTGEPVPAAAAEPPLRVVLEFQQDCWVELVVDGRRRESELKAGGETWAIEAQDSVVLTLGNAPAVRVEVDGRPVRLPTGGTRVVREFRIDRASAETGVAEPAVPGA